MSFLLLSQQVSFVDATDACKHNGETWKYNSHTYLMAKSITYSGFARAEHSLSLASEEGRSRSSAVFFSKLSDVLAATFTSR